MAKKCRRQDDLSDSDEDDENLNSADQTDVAERDKLFGFTRTESRGEAVEVDGLVKSVPSIPKRRSSDDTFLNQKPRTKEAEVTFCQWLAKRFPNCCRQSSEDKRTTIEMIRVQ